MPSVAIMNAKGGVGKSTLTMALAEVLTCFHGKRVLLIDADGQMSLSLMAIPVPKLNEARHSGSSLSHWIEDTVIKGDQTQWQDYGIGQVGDVDDTCNIFLIPGNMDLPLVERQISEGRKMEALRSAVRQFFEEAEEYVDVVLVDCAPGISVVTECFLRECDWHLVPCKPDLLAIGGIEYLKYIREKDTAGKFARHLGVVVNMLRESNSTDGLIFDALRRNTALRTLDVAVPLSPHLQKSALFSAEGRSFQNKYPGASGHALRRIADDILERIGQVHPA